MLPITNFRINHSLTFNSHFILDAIQIGDFAALETYLKKEKISSQLALQALLTAQDQNRFDLIRLILAHLDANTRQEILAKSVDLLDQEGNIVAIEWAKFLPELCNQKAALTEVDKLLSKKEDRNVLKLRLDQIRTQLEKVIQTKSESSCAFRDSSERALKMLDFYGNWKELQTLATLTMGKAEKMPSEDLVKLGINPLNEDILLAKRAQAQKMQSTYLHILRYFAPAHQAMQHPNITLEIKIK